MNSDKQDYQQIRNTAAVSINEADVKNPFIEKLNVLKYIHCPYIKDRKNLEANFRKKFNQLDAFTILGKRILSAQAKLKCLRPTTMERPNRW